jgi:hypothetical protein
MLALERSRDLPVGQISAALAVCLSSFFKKYSDFQKSQISLYHSPSGPKQKGRCARHERWDGMRWTRAVSLTNGTGADGEVVWSWTPSAGVDGGYQAWYAGESTKEAVKTIRVRECRAVPVDLW